MGGVVVWAACCLDAVQMQCVEAEGEHERGGFGGVAFAPVFAADGVAEFAALVASESDADEAD